MSKNMTQKNRKKYIYNYILESIKCKAKNHI